MPFGSWWPLGTRCPPRGGGDCSIPGGGETADHRGDRVSPGLWDTFPGWHRQSPCHHRCHHRRQGRVLRAVGWGAGTNGTRVPRHPVSPLWGGDTLGHDGDDVGHSMGCERDSKGHGQSALGHNGDAKGHGRGTRMLWDVVTMLWDTTRAGQHTTGVWDTVRMAGDTWGHKGTLRCGGDTLGCDGDTLGHKGHEGS